MQQQATIAPRGLRSRCASSRAYSATSVWHSRSACGLRLRHGCVSSRHAPADCGDRSASLPFDLALISIGSAPGQLGTGALIEDGFSWHACALDAPIVALSGEFSKDNARTADKLAQRPKKPPQRGWQAPQAPDRLMRFIDERPTRLDQIGLNTPRVGRLDHYCEPLGPYAHSNPQGSETTEDQPEVSLKQRQREATELGLYGDVDIWTLRKLAERLRDRLLSDPNITQVELGHAPD